MVGKKVQVPVLGGLRKVIRTGEPQDVGTLIAEFGSNRITLAQLRAALQIPSSSSSGGGGTGGAASIVPGPGLVGGGPLVGAVSLALTGPLAIMLGDDGGGGDSEPGPPGQRGVDGATGSGGPAGPAVFMAAADGEDGWHAVPGRDGSNGATGAAGPAGPAIFMSAADGLDGDPGPPGAAGVAGVAGGTGGLGPMGPAVFMEADSIDGEMGPPGPAGPAGSGTTAVAVPGTISDLWLWLKTDPLLMTLANSVAHLTNWCPWFLGTAANAQNGGAKAAATLNSLRTVDFPGNSDCQYSITGGLNLAKMTCFAVYNPTSFGSVATFVSGVTNAMVVRVTTGGNFEIIQAGTASIGTGTTAMTTGVWKQSNVTYDSSTGAYAFRQSSAANGSGTNIKPITQNSTVIGYNGVGGGGEFLNGKLAELIVYNRVLTGPEIASVEAYLLAKWGV